MIFIETMSFAHNNIKQYICVTSGAVLLTDWMYLDAMVEAQHRDIARVLGLQGSPAEPDIDLERANGVSIQGILSDFR